MFAPGAKLEQLASGFSNIAGLTTDENGKLYFTDAAMHKIYKWNADEKKADLLTDAVKTPMAAGVASDGSLLVQDYAKSVFGVDTKTGEAKKIDAASAPMSGTNLMLPVGFHNSMKTLAMQMERRGVVYAVPSNMAIVADVTNEPRGFYYAPGTTDAIMAGGNWQPELQASQWRLFHRRRRAPGGERRG